jgi:dihydropteroate synthase
MIWRTKHRSLDLSRHGVVMGILNVTPDSFSDGGASPECGRATEHALRLLAEGAAIIDIGGESTRPGAEPVPLEEEMRRVLPVVEALRKRAPDCMISVDTSKAAVAAAALDSGAAIINDVTALRGDPAMAGTVARAGAGLVLMHMQGTPRTMQAQPAYGDVVAEVCAFLGERLAAAVAAGIAPECVALDPGIGFGKTAEHNLELLRGLEAITGEGRPVVVGVSRKGFLAQFVGNADMADRLWPTVAMTALARTKGATVLRVHDVWPNLAALKAAEAFMGGPKGIPTWGGGQ